MTSEEIKRFAREKSVLIVGDIMIDRYVKGRVDRMSPEADVPVVFHEVTEEKLGGAANVAKNFLALGCRVGLLSVTGDDAEKRKLEQMLTDQKVRHHLITDTSRVTTLKTRVMDGSRHLLRVDFESTIEIDESTENKVIDTLRRVIAEGQTDMLVFQDYNKGMLTKRVIKEVIEMAKRADIFVTVDPKFVHFNEYLGVDVFKPNLNEAAEALQRNLEDPDDLKNGLKQLQSMLNSRYIVVTLSEKGVIMIDENQEIIYVAAEPIQAVDVCGAGDAVLAIISLLLLKGCPLDVVGKWSNRIGGQICMVPGVGTIQL